MPTSISKSPIGPSLPTTSRPPGSGDQPKTSALSSASTSAPSSAPTIPTTNSTTIPTTTGTNCVRGSRALRKQWQARDFRCLGPMARDPARLKSWEVRLVPGPRAMSPHPPIAGKSPALRSESVQLPFTRNACIPSPLKREYLDCLTAPLPLPSHLTFDLEGSHQ